MKMSLVLSLWMFILFAAYSNGTFFLSCRSNSLSDADSDRDVVATHDFEDSFFDARA